MVEAGQLVLMVDSRLIEVGLPSARFMKKSGLRWLIEGENEDYFAPELIEIYEPEFIRFQETGRELYKMMLETAEAVVNQMGVKVLGIPESAERLIRYSMEKEQSLHLVGRFDFAKGLDDNVPLLLELNADTFSLLPETAMVQPHQMSLLPRKARKNAGQFNRISQQLEQGFRRLLTTYPDRIPDLMLSGLGHQEDWVNLDIVADAAKAAGFQDILQVPLEKVTFSAEEGIFVELPTGEFQRFDFWFKMVPWDFIVFEEPKLLEELTEIICNDLAIVINPAFTMCLQSKALLKFLADRYPNHPSILRCSFSERDFPDRKFALKPVFGRTGDNVQLYNGGRLPAASNGGDYGNLPVVYQELAEFDTDIDGDIYQPSVFWAGDSAALCYRRQDAAIIDDDAEFVGHILYMH